MQKIASFRELKEFSFNVAADTLAVGYFDVVSGFFWVKIRKIYFFEYPTKKWKRQTILPPQNLWRYIKKGKS